MDKFKQLRLKFEQRRSMRSQAAKNEAKSNANDASDVNATAVPESKPEKSEDVIVKCVAMPVKSSPSAEITQMQADMNMAADSDKGDIENKQDTAKEKKSKVVSMPVKRRPAEEKPQPAMKFKVNKDKPASMPVKRRDTCEKDTSEKTKAEVTDTSNVAVTNDKDIKQQEVKTKHVSMPVKARKTSDKDTDKTSVVTTKTNEELSSKESASTEKVKHVSMPVKRHDKKDTENVQTNKGQSKVVSVSANDQANQKSNKSNIVPVTAKSSDKETAKQIVNDDQKGDTDKTANKVGSVTDTQDKDKKVKFVSVGEPGEDTKKEKKPEGLKSALKKSNVSENKPELKQDKLTVEDFNDKAKERKSSLSEDKLQELLETFAVFDQNRDGEITKEELGAVLYALGQRPTVTEVQALIRSVDLDKSGTIDFDEFVKIFSSKLTVDPEQELHEVFCIFDNNLDGFISDDELFEVLQKLGEQTSLAECKKMIQEADLNGDGMVDYREFKAILNSR